MYCAASLPSAVALALASRSRSPVEKCGICRYSISRLHCVPLPDPGGPINTMSMSATHNTVKHQIEASITKQTRNTNVKCSKLRNARLEHWSLGNWHLFEIGHRREAVIGLMLGALAAMAQAALCNPA